MAVGLSQRNWKSSQVKFLLSTQNKKTEMKLRATNLFKSVPWSVPPMILGGPSGDSRVGIGIRVVSDAYKMRAFLCDTRTWGRGSAPLEEGNRPCRLSWDKKVVKCWRLEHIH